MASTASRHTLEEILVDDPSVGLGDNHAGRSLSGSEVESEIQRFRVASRATKAIARRNSLPASVLASSRTYR